jgi:transposase
LAKFLGFNRRTLQRFEKRMESEPALRTGRPRLLSEEEVDRVVEFVTADAQRRRMSLRKVGQHFNCSASTIRRVLAARGLKRYVAVCKPPLDPETRANRVLWAIEHVDWTYGQWCMILWSDETWVTYGSSRRVMVTRYAHEKEHDDCVKAHYQRPLGWMWVGTFHGDKKGPGFYWERKEWGTITAANYQVSLQLW